MSDLIDRAQAMNAVADIRNIMEHMDTVTDNEINRVKRAVERILAELPTVDAVPVIRCEGCEQRKYGCSTFIDHHQIYGFCAWGWKAERKDDDSD